MATTRIGKYACLECERRYLLHGPPPGVPEARAGWTIIDRYLPNSRLRLRRMTSMVSGETIYKLTQKYRLPDQDASQATITNMYLTEAEFATFQGLPAALIAKSRFPFESEGQRYSIDVFQERHEGLTLAEIELEASAALGSPRMPAFAVADVTEDAFFQGGNLALSAPDAFRAGLATRLGAAA